MTAGNEELELKDRLRLIETMIAEGRRTTESYGWTFVLWGVAYYVAIFWAALGHDYLAWPITMTVAGVLTAVIIARKRSKNPATRTSRAIGSIWYAMGISMFVLLFSLGFSERAEPHTFIAIMAAMLATANAASSMILRWKLQFTCALVWWALCVYACFGKSNQLTIDNPLTIAFLAALFFCQILFGIYGMILEARRCRMAANHA
jgi:peptidoglycan/LPS O-acetylase OafA/YrhL